MSAYPSKTLPSTTLVVAPDRLRTLALVPLESFRRSAAWPGSVSLACVDSWPFGTVPDCSPLSVLLRRGEQKFTIRFRTVGAMTWAHTAQPPFGQQAQFARSLSGGCDQRQAFQQLQQLQSAASAPEAALASLAPTAHRCTRFCDFRAPLWQRVPVQVVWQPPLLRQQLRSDREGEYRSISCLACAASLHVRSLADKLLCWTRDCWPVSYCTLSLWSLASLDVALSR